MKIKILGLFGKYNYDLNLEKRLNILVAENGTGKTTILNIINSIYSLDFVELVKYKFKTIEISENKNKIVINYKDLFSSKKLSSIEVSKKIKSFKNLLLSNSGKNDFSFKANVNKQELFNIPKEKFSEEEILDFKAYCITTTEDEFVQIKDSYLQEKYQNIFKFLFSESSRNYVIRLKNQILNDNKAIQIRQGKVDIKIIEGSNLLVSSKIFELVTSIINLNKNEFKESDLNLLLPKVINLNMVKLTAFDNLIIENKKDNYKPAIVVNDYILGKEIFREKYYVNLDINQFFSQKVIRILSENFRKSLLDQPSIKGENSKNDDTLNKNDFKNIITNTNLKNEILKNYYADKNKNRKELTLKRAFDFFNYIENDNELEKNEFKKLNSNLKDFSIYYKQIQKFKYATVKNVEKLINSYFEDKEVEISPERNLVIHDKLGNLVPINRLSSGENKLLILVTRILFGPQNSYYLVDEPELSLSIFWQKRLLKDLLPYIKNKKLIIVTHSSYIANNDLTSYFIPLISKD
jgi:predicted ATPase